LCGKVVDLTKGALVWATVVFSPPISESMVSLALSWAALAACDLDHLE
jgi:hypothetical protein